jgi:hypothetical protein
MLRIVAFWLCANVSVEHRHKTKMLHGATAQKTTMYIHIAIKTSNPTI